MIAGTELVSSLGGKVGKGIELCAVGVRFAEGTGEEEFKGLWKGLRRCYGALGWWLGDAMNFAGETRLVEGKAVLVRAWGEKYARALTQTDREYQTLRNYAWVAGRVDLSRRRDRLSFSHHAEVAGLEAEEQSKWLLRAESEGWSTADLRQALRQAQQTRGKGTNVPAGFVLKPWLAQGLRWLETVDLEDEGLRAALKRDLAPLVAFYEAL